MGWLSKLISGGASEIIDSVTDGVDKFVTTDEERQKLEIMKQELALKFKKLEMDAEMRYMNDRQSAREMGKVDPWTPRILTILFTVAYFGITGFMFSIVMKMFNQDLNDFVVSFISTIFGAFNAIMVQIVSYYFGASKGGDDTGKAIADSFKQASNQS